MKEIKTRNYAFFQNTKCEYFPCHKISNVEKFNCLFCYCPLYFLEDCGGNCSYTEKGVKNCTNCLVPHLNYDYVVNRIVEENQKKK